MLTAKRGMAAGPADMRGMVRLTGRCQLLQVAVLLETEEVVSERFQSTKSARQQSAAIRKVILQSASWIMLLRPGTLHAGIC